MVELTPLVRAETPTTAKNILNRINELASTQGLISEMKDLAAFNARRGRDIRMHVLSLPDASSGLETEPSIKRTVGMELFESLRRKGRATCESWLGAHRASLGVAASVDIEAHYLSALDRNPARSLP
jgi:NTE family protein